MVDLEMLARRANDATPLTATEGGLPCGSPSVRLGEGIPRPASASRRAPDRTTARHYRHRASTARAVRDPVDEIPHSEGTVGVKISLQHDIQRIGRRTRGVERTRNSGRDETRHRGPRRKSKGVTYADENGTIRTWCETCRAEHDLQATAIAARHYRNCGDRLLPIMECRPCMDKELIRQHGSLQAAFMAELMDDERSKPGNDTP